VQVLYRVLPCRDVCSSTICIKFSVRPRTHILSQPLSSSVCGYCIQVISDLVDGDGSIIQINDKKLAATLRLKLKFTDTPMLDANGTS